MTKFGNYFNNDFIYLKDKEKIDIQSLLSDNMYLISGDFYGIQKFIFEGLTTKNAAKVLRAKSAFVQLFTIVISRYICDRLGIEEKNILIQNAGKFEILSTKMDENIIKEIQQTINEYFIKNFYGLSGINICYVNCTKNDFIDSIKYKKFRENIANKIEKIKFKKFDLLSHKFVLSYDENITNQSLCRICNIRKVIDKNEKEARCYTCDVFVKLGKKLVSKEVSKISSKEDLNIDFFETIINLTPKIKSYVAMDNKDNILDFEDFSDNSKGTKAIAVLKADVDGMGNFIKNSDITESFENFDLFSKTLDNFFSIHIPKKMEEKYPSTYTIFAGGDDLFLLGSWNIILELARFIESEFKRFVINKELTISFGITMSKPSKPINYLANETEHLLEKSKAIDGKDAITLFGETVKWANYKNIFNQLTKELSLVDEKDISTAFLYRLLDFCEMSKKSKESPLENMWKSKLVYSFTRNMNNKYISILNVLNNLIENNPKETRMILCEFIYKRRKDGTV